MICWRPLSQRPAGKLAGVRAAVRESAARRRPWAALPFDTVVDCHWLVLLRDARSRLAVLAGTFRRNDSAARPRASRHRQQQKAAQGGAASLEHVAGADYQYKARVAIAEKPSRPRYPCVWTYRGRSLEKD